MFLCSFLPPDGHILICNAMEKHLRMWKDAIKVVLREVRYEGVDCELAEDKVEGGLLKRGITFRIPQRRGLS